MKQSLNLIGASKDQISPAVIMPSRHPLEDRVDGGDEREEEERDDDEEEKEAEELRFKYQRMGGSLPSLLSTDAASSIATTKRMIALGMHDGTVHILDFQGNQEMDVVERVKSGFEHIKTEIYE